MRTRLNRNPMKITDNGERLHRKAIPVKKLTVTPALEALEDRGRTKQVAGPEKRRSILTEATLTFSRAKLDRCLSMRITMLMLLEIRRNAQLHPTGKQ
jgi:DNA-binding MarR family transcriptional regulator